MTEEEKIQFEELKREVEDMRFRLSRQLGLGSADIKANFTLGDVNIPDGGISSSSMFTASVVDQAAIGADAVGDSELKYELVTTTISDAGTSNTATITSGSVLFGAWISAFSGTPAASHYKVETSGTTLTVTLVTAPGGGNSLTFKAALIKT